MKTKTYQLPVKEEVLRDMCEAYLMGTLYTKTFCIMYGIKDDADVDYFREKFDACYENEVYVIQKQLKEEGKDYDYEAGTERMMKCIKKAINHLNKIHEEA